MPRRRCGSTPRGVGYPIARRTCCNWYSHGCGEHAVLRLPSFRDRAKRGARNPDRYSAPASGFRVRTLRVRPGMTRLLDTKEEHSVMLAGEGFLDIGGERLEYRMIGPRPEDAPTLVLLHEGLGCAGMWGDFPDKLAAATGAGVFIYSRAGYGKSSPVPLPRPLTYMHDEARQTMPRLLDVIGFRRGLLVGHSDGASIATIYAGSVQDHRVRGLVLIAPHFFTEAMGLAEIAKARVAYDKSDLRQKLARWHADVDNAFNGWNGAWLHPDFQKWDIIEALSYIRVPMLIVQGKHDQYGTVKQIEVAQEECTCPVEVALLPAARHAPHREAADATLKVVSEFANRLLRDHQEGEMSYTVISASSPAMTR